MKNRSYIGDGVYASFNEQGEVVLELETRYKIVLAKDTFHSLVEYIQRNNAMFDPHCQLIEVPRQIFPEVVAELRELEKAAKDTKPAH